MVHHNYTKECGCSDIWPPSIFYGAYVQLEDCFTSYSQIKDSEERVCYKKKQKFLQQIKINYCTPEVKKY